MNTYNYHYKKRLKSAGLVAVVAATGLLITALPFSFANAQNDNRSPVADIVEQFFKWRESDRGSSHVSELIPPGIAKKIFDRFEMPGVGHDDTDPEISDITTDTDEEEVRISWSTDERTRGVVYISEDSPVDMDDDDTMTLSSWRLSKDHTVSSDDLDEETTYYALIKATDQRGNETVSDEWSFTLDQDDEDNEDPIITNVEWDRSSTSITVQWDTDEPATSAVHTSTSTGFEIGGVGVSTVSSDSLTESHELTISGLTASTTYYHRIVSIDDDGNETISMQYSNTTD